MKVVYMAKNILTGDFYIGVDSYWPKRKYHHQHLAKRGDGFHFHNALRKYGEDSFEWTILETVEDESLYEKEKIWIDSKKPTYNLTLGGEGRSGPMKEETKKKIAEKLKGNKNGLGGKALAGKNHNEETKKLISDKMKKARNEKNWSTKKKNGAKIVKGGISEWTKEERSLNAKKVGSLLWWNNGVVNIRSADQPKGFIRGRIK